MFFMMARFQWFHFSGNWLSIPLFMAGKTNFGSFYKNEAWESVRIFCHFKSSQCVVHRPFIAKTTIVFARGCRMHAATCGTNGTYIGDLQPTVGYLLLPVATCGQPLTGYNKRKQQCAPPARPPGRSAHPHNELL